MERQYSTVLWRDLDFIRHLDPAIKVSHRTKQGVKFFAELTITSVDGIDAEGGSKSDHQSDNNSDNKVDITGFLLDNSPASCEERDGVIDLVFEPLFKDKSFGHWVKMEVKVTEDTNCQYYPVGEVWIGDDTEKFKNPYSLTKHSSSPRPSESSPTNNSSTSSTSINPNSRLTINTNSGETYPYFTTREPLKMVPFEYCFVFEMALAPALPPPNDWPNGQPYHVVINTVFKELERQGVVLREACHSVPIEACHLQKEYEWIPPNEIIWYIPGTEYDIEMVTGYTLAFAGMFLSLQPRLFMYQSATSCTNEARCVTSMIKINDDTGTPEILGYDKGKYFETWVDFDSIDYDGNADLGGFPTKIIDQYGQPPAALHVSGELHPLETYLAPPSM
ncbi:hypothetical protein FOPG_16798 [Fusarium oxysporum f. sp. conglutinans race 2 54008]|uniref:Uncharacterized protein n=1 Tax=Fusarium oxysporum f. sp. conglutinans race 2 54008 TaxID=1089457 RepID=X0GUI5_FUSOX|nr:hypothetical protein FOPG_16798 [Fusarium oxysporum f. sp. conglutinans race 2 54008]